MLLAFGAVGCTLLQLCCFHVASQLVSCIECWWQNRLSSFLTSATTSWLTHMTLSCSLCPSCVRRLWQIVEWLAGAEGGEVLIVFDECHRAKNLIPSAAPGGSFGETRSTKTGLAVLALQNALPNARCGPLDLM